MSEDLREERQGDSEKPQPIETHDEAEARNDFWSIEGDYIYRHHTSLTRGSGAMPVLLRPCSIIALPPALYLPPPQAPRAALVRSALVAWIPEPELRGIRAVVQFFRQSAEHCAAPPTSPFMALLMDPLAVKAQARFQRFSSVCGCIIRFLLRSGPECCCLNTSPVS